MCYYTGFYLSLARSMFHLSSQVFPYVTLSTHKTKVSMLNRWYVAGEQETGSINRHMGGSGCVSGGAFSGAAPQGCKLPGCEPLWHLVLHSHRDPHRAQLTPITPLDYDLATTHCPWVYFSKWSNLELSSCHALAKPYGTLLSEDTSEIDCTCDLFFYTTILPLIFHSHPFATPAKHTKLIIMSNSEGKILWDSTDFFVWGFGFFCLSSDCIGREQKAATRGVSKIN